MGKGKVLSVKDVAETLSISESTVRRWIKKRIIKGSKHGRQWRIWKADVAEILSEKPQVFIGSSTEGLEIAEKVAKYLEGTKIMKPRVWPEAFDLGDTGIETLFRELDNSDYAILVATGEDRLVSREVPKMVPRDNIIFEAGLFMGRLGRKRSFVMCEAGLKLPSDLAGVTVAKFSLVDPGSLEKASERIADAIANRKTEREVDFLRAYFTFINPEVELWDTYADILEDHYNAIRTEVDRLRTHGNWSKVLDVKKRLREYFEYSGMYERGISFGISYVEALRNLKRYYDAAWSQIKDVGYMHILNGDYDEGQETINDVIENISDWVPNISPKSRAKLLFYAYRYLAISFHRDKALGSMEKTRCYLDKAARQLNAFKPNTKAHRELKARYLRNLGHLELEDGKIEQAIEHYRKSLELFDQIRDREHIGIAHLALAKAVITEGIENPVPHLQKAERIFVSIGWIEGQARIHEQFARYYIKLAGQESSINDAKKLLDDAASALEHSEVMFGKIHSGRFSDRLDPLRDSLRQLLNDLENPNE